jgi:hypothetical protein
LGNSVQKITTSIRNGRCIFMDMAEDGELGRYLERLREVPFVRRARVEKPNAQRPREVIVKLDTPTEQGVPFVVELKRTHLTREVAERLLHLRKRAGAKLLLFAPVVGRDLAELFARERLDFVDLAGNCLLDIDGRYVAHVEGRRPESKGSTRALRAPTYRVLFALLAKPELSQATARVLAEASGKVSPQTALDARLRLIERGILVGSKSAPRWAPGGYRAALDMFVSGFDATLRPSLAIGRFRARQRSIEHLETELARPLLANAAGLWRWGGGAASQRLTGHFRGDTTIVYVERAPPNVAKSLGLLPQPLEESAS